MALTAYNKKRNFKKTKEPPGKISRGVGGNRYLIQKHDATRLHYDFRLELNGVLLSWAVPKGPSLSSADKRLAVQTEDHPLAYGDFEGTIPEGEYGGGTVMLWDTGTWNAEGDPVKTLKNGKLDFTLHGKRLKGRWHLTKMHGDSYGKSNWLMIKSHDAFENDDGTAAIDAYQVSVMTDRTMEEIAKGSKVWRSNHLEKTQPKKAKSKSSRQLKTKFKFKAPEKARAMKAMRFIEPQLATLHNDPPISKQWLHEIKYDGYRIQLVKNGDTVKAYTRRGLDWSARFPELLEAVAVLPIENAIIDGEIVVNNHKGVSSFQLLQNALDNNKQRGLVYHAFDLLVANGNDLRAATLLQRKEILRELLAKQAQNDTIQFSDHILGQGKDVFAKSCSLSLEGIISKRADASYMSGRSKTWLKSKCVKRQEMVIGGYVEPKLKSRGIGALLLGHYKDGKLIFSGKVGTGFTNESGTSLRKQIDAFKTKTNPFVAVPGEARRGAVWVKPHFVAEIEYTEWTDGGALRHPSFIAVREDKPATEVRREDEGVEILPEAKAAAEKLSRKRAHMKDSTRSKVGNVVLNPNSPPDMELTSPGKILYPGQGLTKLDLAAYYHQVAEWALPHLAGRPLSLVRCPEGRAKFCFFQRHVGKGTPDGIKTVEVERKGKTEPYLMIDDERGLLSLVQIGALEIHPWGALSDDPDKPDRIVMDMDPDEGLPFERVKQAALEAKERLEGFGLQSFLKTTGGKGLHVVVPLARRQTWKTVKAFAKAIAQGMEADSPGKYLSKMSKAARKGKVFVDYLRNEKTATAIGAYSTRSRENAPVSTPLFWDELDDLQAANVYTVTNLAERLSSLRSNPWSDIGKIKLSITQVMLKKAQNDI